MSKKRVLNIKAQEIVTDGRRSVRYRGSDGKMHDLASSENGSSESGPVESPATAQSLQFDIRQKITSDSYTSNQLSNMTYTDFELKYRGKTAFQNFKINVMQNGYTSRNKIYGGNGVSGGCSYYYDLTSTQIKFIGKTGEIEVIDRSLMQDDIAQVKEFFERTMAMMMNDITIKQFYFFLRNMGDWVTSIYFEMLENRLIITDPEGNTFEGGYIVPKE